MGRRNMGGRRPRPDGQKKNTKRRREGDLKRGRKKKKSNQRGSRIHKKGKTFEHPWTTKSS